MSTASNVVSLREPRQVCRECGLRDECLAPDLVDPAAARIPAAPRVVQRGEHVFYAGDRLDGVYTVRSGSFKTYMINAEGEEQVIGFHIPGDLLGLNALSASRHACSARALDTSSVCMLPIGRLKRLCGHSQTVLQRLMAKMSRKMLHDESLLMMLGHKNSDQRIASFVWTQARRQAERGYAADVINLSMSRADIASYLALAVETVSRVLTRLQDGGLIRVDRNHVEIADPPGLARVAGISEDLLLKDCACGRILP